MASNDSSSLRPVSICTSSSERSSDSTSDSTSQDSANNEQTTRFIDNEHDPLIPSLEDVHRTFQEGKATWEAFLSQAKRIPRGLWPKDALNPYVTLVDVPSLPDELPRSNWLYGRPFWELSHDIGGTECRNTHSRSNTTSPRPGRLVSFRLQIGDPIRCDVCPDAASYACTSPEMTDSLAVLVMCWSYILSARLLEMQRRGIRYTEDRLWPTVPQDRKETTADINLKSASPTLIRWLCAILSPAMGWQARDHGHLPPWATSFKTEVTLVIEASDMAADVCSPPSSIEAMELLIELCRLFGLGIDSRLTDFEPVPPYKASFLAALALPFYNFMELQPQLPHPRLAKPRNNSTFSSSHEQQMRGYLCHIRYFMTLSAHPPSIGSILWSVFWQPDVNCNLVGPWLASILDTLEPTIAQNDVEVLLKVFLSRRPRIGIWWVALFFLGDSALLDWIRRYTVKMEEKRGFGSLSSPDPMVSAWTGSKQSFIDFDNDLLYLEPSDSVSRADLLRCRFDLRLQDSATTALSWRPFGHIQKSQVELELWPQLETKYTRRYNAFAWYPRKNFPILDEGFRKDTGQHIINVPDNLKMHPSTEYLEKKSCVTNMRPSKESTSKMMGFLVEGVGGGRDWANAGLSMQPKQLRWLRDWEGLDRMENNVVEQEPSRTPSWLLEKWINGEI